MNRKFRFGILGTAQIARPLVRAIRQSRNAEVTAIASRSPEKARHWAREFGLPLHFGSYQALLESGKVDGIYNPLPNSMHAEWTIRALEAGLPVLCEKPIAANAREAAKMHRAAQRTGQYLAEAFMYRFHPVYRKIRELIAAGAIGRVSTIFSRFTFLLDDRSQIPASAPLAGGALMDVGCYCVNASRLIAGAEPTRVSALARSSEVDDTLVGLMEFPGVVLAQFETSIENYERHLVEVFGTKGALILSDPWVPGRDAKEIIIKRAGRRDRRIAVKGKNTYQLEVEEFVEVCRGRKQPSWSSEDSINNMKVIDALHRSAREGKAVKL